MQHLSWRACRQATPAVLLLRAQFQQRTVGMGEAPVLRLLFHGEKFTAARREGHKYLRRALFGRKTQLSQSSYSLEVPSPMRVRHNATLLMLGGPHGHGARFVLRERCFTELYSA